MSEYEELKQELEKMKQIKKENSVRLNTLKF